VYSSLKQSNPALSIAKKDEVKSELYCQYSPRRIKVNKKAIKKPIKKVKTLEIAPRSMYSDNASLVNG
jgi:hypothetical protein